jgi:hypothetical protein
MLFSLCRRSISSCILLKPSSITCKLFLNCLLPVIKRLRNHKQTNKQKDNHKLIPILNLPLELVSSDSLIFCGKRIISGNCSRFTSSTIPNERYNCRHRYRGASTRGEEQKVDTIIKFIMGVIGEELEKKWDA